LQEAIEKADVLIEALGWIRRFRDKITVIKLGGSAMEDRDALRHILVDLVFMETVGMKPVVVHGGGAPITRAMDQAGLEPQFIMGRRYTDPETLAIVKRVLGQEICTEIARRIEELGGAATPLNFDTHQVLFGRRIHLTAQDGKRIDLGLVGEVTRVDREAILAVCQQGRIPVIPSLCQEEGTDQLLNVNADTAATAIAQQLGAEKLVYVSDVNGVRRDKDDPNTHIQSLTAEEARGLIRSGVINSGMIPKVEACLETLDRGVRKVHIIDGGLRHSLLLEIYTTQGVGTEIVADR
jgi:acetylglutamate kinase